MIAAIPLAYIIPPLCYIRLEAGSLTSLAKIPAVLLASFGIIVTTVGTISIFTNVCDHQDCNCILQHLYIFTFRVQTSVKLLKTCHIAIRIQLK